LRKNSRRIVFDTSALISLALGDVLELAIEQYEPIISLVVLDELKETAKYDDGAGQAAEMVLGRSEALNIEKVPNENYRELITSRIDEGEASCIPLARREDHEAFITDDFSAAHQLRTYSRKYNFDLGLSAVLLKALNIRGELSQEEMESTFDRIARKRGWLGQAIYKYGKDIL
jgi:predicted nucleic acid-binding protein